MSWCVGPLTDIILYPSIFLLTLAIASLGLDLGRPGIAQLAGIEPGDELIGVWICPDVRVEAGCMGRAWMTKELRRLAQWGRSRGRGVPHRESFISDEHMEWEFPWELEFCRREVEEDAFSGAGIEDTGGCEQEGEGIVSSLSSSVSPQVRYDPCCRCSAPFLCTSYLSLIGGQT